MDSRSNVTESSGPRVLADAMITRARIEWGVSQDMAEGAATVTLARIPWEPRAPRRSERRWQAYFWAVLRRKVLRSKDTKLRALRARFALASVAQDLRAAGFDDGEVRVRLAADCPDVLAEAGVCVGQMELAG